MASIAVPDALKIRFDARAKKLGISGAEYLKLLLRADAADLEEVLVMAGYAREEIDKAFAILKRHKSDGEEIEAAFDYVEETRGHIRSIIETLGDEA